MSRFASTVEFYARYREPYPPEFFQKVAEQISLRGDETLLDVGCGPGMLAIGFAPLVGSCIGLDPEPLMIAAARSAAAEAGVALSLIGVALRNSQPLKPMMSSLLAAPIIGWNAPRR
jgi:SAM-dependent methyltransferase